MGPTAAWFQEQCRQDWEAMKRMTQPAPPTYRIKPLVWTPPSLVQDGHIAFTPFGKYIAYDDTEHLKARLMVPAARNRPMTIADFESVQSAKAFAEDHWRQTLLQALEEV